MNNNTQSSYYGSNNYVSKNSRKGVYIAVGIASLIVAVISGTFAFFTASVTNEETIRGNIMDTGLELKVKKLEYPEGTSVTDMIPMNTVSFEDMNVALNHHCVDSHGFTACQVYRISVTLPANSNRLNIKGIVNIKTDLDVNGDSSISNLNYALLGPQTSGINVSSINELSTTDKYYNANVTLGNDLVFSDIDLDDSPQNGYLDTTGDKAVVYDYYIVVWLEDTGDDQSKVDVGSFIGTVSVDSANGNITATFS